MTWGQLIVRSHLFKKNLLFFFSKSWTTSWTTLSSSSPDYEKLPRPSTSCPAGRRWRKEKRKVQEVSPLHFHMVLGPCWVWLIAVFLRATTRGRAYFALQTSHWGRVHRLPAEVQTRLQPAGGEFNSVFRSLVCNAAGVAFTDLTSTRVFFCSDPQAKLKDHIQNPSAMDLVHFLFAPLKMVSLRLLLSLRSVINKLWRLCSSPQVIQASGSPDLARSVVVPLLTRDAIEFLHEAGTAEERHLWVALGDGWTKCRWGSGGDVTNRGHSGLSSTSVTHTVPFFKFLNKLKLFSSCLLAPPGWSGPKISISRHVSWLFGTAGSRQLYRRRLVSAN